MITKSELIEFEKEISELFLQRKISVPIHLSGGNEDILIDIFKNIKKNDWVFSTHRNHYHALLKGIDKKKLKNIILSGESMHIYDNKVNFFTSSIVGGVLPIALGVAISIKRKKENRKVYVFVGDMCGEMGIFNECTKYAARNSLPITFIIEDNGVSVDTNTQRVWGIGINKKPNIIRYKYNRVWPHTGVGKWVQF
jgi:pyruvate dehydrogenase E1 component alpha subunit